MIIGSGGRRYTRGYRSASEIAGMIGDPEPLVRWSISEVRAGRDPISSRDRASAVGTAAHAMAMAALVTRVGVDRCRVQHADIAEARCSCAEIGAHVYGCPEHPLYPLALAEGALRSALAWLDDEERASAERAGARAAQIVTDYIDAGWEPILAECSLESDTLCAAGTPDLIIRRGEDVRIVDWKSARLRTDSGRKRRVFREKHAIQIGIYALIAEDALGTPVTSGEIIYLGRDVDDQPVSRRIEGAAWRATLRAARQTIAVVRYLDRAREVWR